jgi:hypothetical protein
MGTGVIDPQDVAILQGIGAWWKVNGESIRGTTRTALPVQAWGESTRKGNTLYLHVFNWPANGTLVIGGLKSDVKSVRPLWTSRALPLTVRRSNPLDVSIAGLPTVAPDAADTVLALECADAGAADPVRLLQPAFASDTLRIFDANLRGQGLRFGPGKVRDAYAYEWTRPDQFIVWPVRLNQAATFEVGVTYDAEAGSAGGTFTLSAGASSLKGAVQPGTIRTISLGRVSLPAGNAELKLSALEIRGNEMMKPRSLTLKPAAP